MKITILILILIIFILCIKLFSLDRTLKKLAKDIRSKKNSQSNVLTTTSTNNKSVRKLITEVNLMFDSLSESHNSEIKERENFQFALHNITHDIRTPLTISLG
ncbi:hypothetical protein CON87_32800, partial [Bacillus cereus]|uniref:hypothetical protein n=1 Tax=Bacillus cereus TaxID=1396 RepID=UPI000BECC5E4